MNNVIRVIIAEISIRKKDILGIIGFFIFLYLWHKSQFLYEIEFRAIWTISFTIFALPFEMQFFKEKYNRFSGLPISRTQIFLIEAFRMSILIIFLNIAYLILFGFYDYTEDKYISKVDIINYTVGYFGLTQFIIMLRHVRNLKYNIFEKIIAGIFYTAYLIFLVNFTHYLIDMYVADFNYFALILINFIALIIFISLLLPANYFIFIQRRDFLK